VSTAKDLRAELNHVLYELEMMHFAAQRASAMPEGPEQNALLESFLIHTRALDEFFSNKPKRGNPDQSDDMRASDFVAGFAVTEPHPELSRMHKEVGHLTYSRKGIGELRRWELQQTAKPVAKSALTFLRSILTQPEMMGFKDNRERTDNLLTALAWAGKDGDGIAWGTIANPQYVTSSGPTVVTG
jgi:hypothetical protein